MPTLRYYRIPDDAAADNSARGGTNRPTGAHNQQYEVPAPAQREAASAAAAGASSLQPLPAQVPSAKIPRHQQPQQQQVGEKAAPITTIRPASPAEVTTTTTNSPAAARRPGQLLPTRWNARAGASTTLDATEVTASANAANTTTKQPEHDSNVTVPGIGATNVAPAPLLTPPTAGEEAAAEANAAAAYSAAASSVASLWNGSASVSAASAAASARAASIGMMANQQQRRQQYRHNLLTAAASAASEATMRTAPASQLLGMMTPAQQTSALARCVSTLTMVRICSSLLIQRAAESNFLTNTT